MNEHNYKVGRKFIFIPIFFAAISALVMFLWNWLMPELFALKHINYWQAMGLLLLSRILVGGFHFGGKPKFAERKAMREKFMGMTDEEKEAFKEQWKQRCRK